MRRFGVLMVTESSEAQALLGLAAARPGGRQPGPWPGSHAASDSGSKSGRRASATAMARARVTVTRREAMILPYPARRSTA
jgi:hypothetical protein